VIWLQKLGENEKIRTEIEEKESEENIIRKCFCTNLFFQLRFLLFEEVVCVVFYLDFLENEKLWNSEGEPEGGGDLLFESFGEVF